jgi:hypothetical protein
VMKVPEWLMLLVKTTMTTALEQEIGKRVENRMSLVAVRKQRNWE